MLMKQYTQLCYTLFVLLQASHQLHDVHVICVAIELTYCSERSVTAYISQSH